MDIYAVKKDQLKIKHTDAKEMANEILDWVKEGKVVTLATDYRWIAKDFVSPYIGRYVNISERYSSDLDVRELFKILHEHAKIEMLYGLNVFYLISAA